MRLRLPFRLRALACGLRRVPGLRLRLQAGLVLLLSAFLVFRGLREGGALGGGRRNDFAAYHGAARAALQGELASSYQAERPYQYPPTLAVLLLPLGLLPEPAAALLWTLGSLALLLRALRAAGAALGPPVGSLDQLLGFLLIFRMAESDFSNGNANSLVLAVLLLGFERARRAHTASGGALLGLACALKVAPVLLLPWIVAGRRWRMAGGFLLGLLLAGVVLPGLVLGPRQFLGASRAFYEVTLRPLDPSGGYREEAEGGYLAGQSLRALLHRLLRPIDATAHDRQVVRVNVAELPKGTVDGIYLGLAAALLCFLLFAFRARRGEWSGPEIGAALAAMVLLSPLSRKAHFVALLPAAAAGFAAFRLAPPRRRVLLGVLWWTAFALCALTAPALSGRSLSRLLLTGCPLSLAAGALLVVCAAAPARLFPERPPPGPPLPSPAGATGAG